MFNCITGVDYFAHRSEKKAKPRPTGSRTSEVVYHLWSMKNIKHTWCSRSMLPRWKDDQEGQLPEMPSVAGVWRTADWHEREVYDLSGVRFTGPSRSAAHPLPGRLGGTPLRKDYEMPLEYHGIRGR